MKKFFSSTFLKVFFCISVALFIFIFGSLSAFAMTESDSFTRDSNTQVEIFSNVYTDVGDIIMPVGSNQNFAGRIGITGNGHIVAYYTPYGNVKWDIYTRSLTSALIQSAFTGGTLQLALPGLDSNLFLDFSQRYFITITYSDLFSGISISGGSYSFVTNLGDSYPSYANRFGFDFNIVNYSNQYTIIQNYALMPNHANSNYPAATYGDYPRLNAVLYVLKLMYDTGYISDYFSTNVNRYFIRLDSVTWYPYFELKTEQNTLDDWRTQEIIQKIDTIDDTLNQSDPRASQQWTAAHNLVDDMEDQLSDIESDTYRPDVHDQITGFSQTVTQVLSNSYFVTFAGKIFNPIVNDPFIMSIIGCSMALMFFKFFIYGKG